jgi:hypothetical protein
MAVISLGRLHRLKARSKVTPAHRKDTKEAILSREFNSLLERLNDEEREKLNNRLMEIKRKVKVYQELPIEAYQK